jgi:hypothetical protein
MGLSSYAQSQRTTVTLSSGAAHFVLGSVIARTNRAKYIADSLAVEHPYRFSVGEVRAKALAIFGCCVLGAIVPT